MARQDCFASWNNAMDKLDTLTLFVRIVERGSFSAAAADLGFSRPVATAAIKALEASLGARLLQRTTRHVQPTAEGSLYYQRCVSILAALEEANRSAGGASPASSGWTWRAIWREPCCCPRCRSFSPAIRPLRYR
jgi:DNA-binding transcriptional LysR family regulator